MSDSRAGIIDRILSQCPPPSDPNDWVGKQMNIDTCMTPVAAELGYQGCHRCLGSGQSDAGDQTSALCDECDGYGIVRLTQ